MRLDNLDQARSIGPALIAFFAVLGFLGLVHALVTAVREREAMLAMLRLLGSRRAHVRRAVLWQAVFVTSVSLLVGLPTGVAIGRWAWSQVIADLGVVAPPQVDLDPRGPRDPRGARPRPAGRHRPRLAGRPAPDRPCLGAGMSGAPMSAWEGDEYQARFDRLAASGTHVHGEADFVTAFAPTSVLDAGCGTGRVSIELAGRGMEVVGTDVDPSMLATARRRDPDLTWVEADLTTLDLGRAFDLVLLAGNVPLFTPPGTQPALVAHCAAHLARDGHLVAGFSIDRGYGLDGLGRRLHRRRPGARRPLRHVDPRPLHRRRLRRLGAPTTVGLTPQSRLRRRMSPPWAATSTCPGWVSATRSRSAQWSTCRCTVGTLHGDGRPHPALVTHGLGGQGAGTGQGRLGPPGVGPEPVAQLPPQVGQVCDRQLGRHVRPPLRWA